MSKKKKKKECINSYEVQFWGYLQAQLVPSGACLPLSWRSSPLCRFYSQAGVPEGQQDGPLRAAGLEFASRANVSGKIVFLSQEFQEMSVVMSPAWLMRRVTLIRGGGALTSTAWPAARNGGRRHPHGAQGPGSSQGRNEAPRQGEGTLGRHTPKEPELSHLRP